VAALSSTLRVEELRNEEMDRWDRFVASSPQGTVFSESIWLQMLGYPFRILACYKGQDLVGGMAVFEDSQRPRATMGLPPFTPFQGILFRDAVGMKPVTRESSEKKTSFALIQALHERYDRITVPLHYTYGDIRPFYWDTYGQSNEYSAVVRYTYVVDLRDPERAWTNMDDNTRFEVRKAEKHGSTVEESDDFAAFQGMHRRTFERQGADHEIEGRLLGRVYEALKSAGRCQLFLARNQEGFQTSGVLALWDRKRAYYMFGASEPEHRNDGSASLTLWKVFQCMGQRLPEMDMVGCNSPKRGAFKAGFGGRLAHYFVMSLDRSSHPLK
jgi:Acetyltransferase (GNAT) domain